MQPLDDEGKSDVWSTRTRVCSRWRAEESVVAGSWGGDSMCNGLAYQINPTNLK